MTRLPLADYVPFLFAMVVVVVITFHVHVVSQLVHLLSHHYTTPFLPANIFHPTERSHFGHYLLIHSFAFIITVNPFTSVLQYGLLLAYRSPSLYHTRLVSTAH